VTPPARHARYGVRICVRLASYALVILAAWLVAATPAAARTIVVGSKVFTESVVLGEIIVARLEADGLRAEHRRELGGTRVVWNALERGDVDVYVEYTGTIVQELLAGEDGVSADSLAAALAGHGIGVAASLGFNNTYVLGVRADTARDLGIRRLSDLRGHPGLRYGLSNEFMSRADGWPGLQAAYGVETASPRGLQHELAYRALAEESVDVIDLYSTDAEIPQYGIVTLADDRGYFPRYDAVILHRLDLGAAAIESLRGLQGVLDEPRMAALNAAVQIERRPERDVATDFVGTPRTTASAAGEGRWQRFVDRTLEHLTLVGASLGAAIVIAIPLGIFGFLRPRFGELVLGITSIVQTIPALALLVFMIPWLGIGAWPAIAALFLYSLLPIVRNTHLGLSGVPHDVRESAVVLGLPTAARLRLVELPLAMPSILAGIRTAAVINIGTATLGALIGAGGYGEPILTGIRLDDIGLILEGAVPAALLALLVQSLRPFRRRSPSGQLK
jgi:osmoprotectant transport system permease protein